MKKTAALIVLLSSLSVSAMTTGGSHNYMSNEYRNNGTHNNGYSNRTMKVDMKYLTYGLEAYKSGSLNDAMKLFKKSARLGNNMSKYLTALVYFENNEPIKGYAWLQLLEQPVDQSADLLNKLSKVLTEDEKSMAAAQLVDLKKKYNNTLGNQSNKYLAALNTNK